MNHCGEGEKWQVYLQGAGVSAWGRHQGSTREPWDR